MFTLLAYPIVFILLGGIFFSEGALGIAKGYIVQSWPTTTGKIIESKLEYTGASSRAGKTTEYFSPRVIYLYQVAGSEYSSSNIQNRDTFRSKVYGNIYAETVMKQYSAGNTVAVHYNPRNASEAFLMPQIDSQFYLSAVFGFLLLTFGIAASLLVYFPESAANFLRKFKKPVTESIYS